MMKQFQEQYSTDLKTMDCDQLQIMQMQQQLANMVSGDGATAGDVSGQFIMQQMNFDADVAQSFPTFDNNGVDEMNPHQMNYNDDLFQQPEHHVLWGQNPQAEDEYSLPRLSQADLNILSRNDDVLDGENPSSYAEINSSMEQYGFPQHDDESDGVEEMDEEPLPKRLLVAAGTLLRIFKNASQKTKYHTCVLSN